MIRNRKNGYVSDNKYKYNAMLIRDMCSFNHYQGLKSLKIRKYNTRN